jgi:hypothetical protein
MGRMWLRVEQSVFTCMKAFAMNALEIIHWITWQIRVVEEAIHLSLILRLEENTE